MFDTVGNQIERANYRRAYISSLLSSSAGQALYASDVEILQSIYTAAYGNSPTTAQLQAILAGSTLNDAISSAINSLLNYSGFDSGTLASQSNFDAQLNNVLFGHRWLALAVCRMHWHSIIWLASILSPGYYTSYADKYFHAIPSHK